MNKLVGRMKIIAVPLFQDNYSYIVLGIAPKKLVLVDPANPPVVMDYVKKYLPDYAVNCLLYTHKHWDHAGGSEQLIQMLADKDLKVVAGQEDGYSIKGSNLLVRYDTEIEINQSKVKVYNVPCHTRGHLLYHFDARNTKYYLPSFSEATFTSEDKRAYEFESEEFLFTGDTLFSAGVGRFFEGNAKDMLGNFKKLVQLNNGVHIFNGHEYTRQNLEWASKVEPDNQDLQEYYELSKVKACTLPSTIAHEKRVNVFLRVLNPSPALSKFGSEAEELLKELRQMKNENRTTVSPPSSAL